MVSRCQAASASCRPRAKLAWAATTIWVVAVSYTHLDVYKRQTLMNPYLIDHENSISYIDLYFEHLATRLAELGAQA